MPDFTVLGARISGLVLTPTDPDFVGSVAGFNTAVVQTPQVAVRASTAQDVVEAVRFAREFRSRKFQRALTHHRLVGSMGRLMR